MAELELKNGGIYTYTYGDKSNTVSIDKLFEIHVITDENKKKIFYKLKINNDKLKINNNNLNTINTIEDLINYINNTSNSNNQYILDQQQNFKNKVISIDVNGTLRVIPGRAETYGAICSIMVESNKKMSVSNNELPLNNTQLYNNIPIIIPDIDCFTWTIPNIKDYSKIKELKEAYLYRSDDKSNQLEAKNLFSCKSINTNTNTNTISDTIHGIDIKNLFEMQISNDFEYVKYIKTDNYTLDNNKIYACIGDITFLKDDARQVNTNALIPDVSYFYWKSVLPAPAGGSRKRRTQKKRKSRRRKSFKKSE